MGIKEMNNKIYGFVLWTGMLLLLLYMPVVRGTVRIWSAVPFLITVFFLTFLWFYKVNNSTVNPRNTVLDKPIAAFIFLAVVSAVFSIYKYVSVSALLLLAGYASLYYLIANNYTRRFRKYLISIIICLGIGLSVYGLLQYFNVLDHTWWRPNYMLASTYVNHNHFAGYLELVIPVTIGVLIRYMSKRSLRFILTLGILIMGTAFVFSQSRGAWICLTFSLFVMNILLIRKKILNKKSIIVFALIFSAIFTYIYFNEGFVSERLETMVDLTGEEASMSTRIAIWRGTLDMISSRPFIGTGIGTFLWGFPRFKPESINYIRPRFAHNDYLHMASEMGVLAPVIMLWFLWLIIGKGLKKKSHPVIIGCSIGMLSLTLHGFVDFNFHIPANMALFVIYAAIVTREGSNTV